MTELEMTNNFKDIIKKLENKKTLTYSGSEAFQNENLLNESLQCSILGGVRFVNTTFENIDFTGSMISKVIFKDCYFNNTTLRKADLWNCGFVNCKIKQSDFTRTNFNSTILENSKVSNTDLKGSNLVDCKLNNTIFINCNLKLLDVSNSQIYKHDKYYAIKDPDDFLIVLKEMKLLM